MIGVPFGAVYCSSRKSPTVAVARYAAIGSGAFQRHVVLPSAVSDPSRSPLATATRPSGTVIS